MNNVNLDLERYDELQDRIRELELQLERKDEEHRNKLKESFQLDKNYSSISLYINAEAIVKELYGDEIDVVGKKYFMNKERDFECSIYSLWQEEEKEDK